MTRLTLPPLDRLTTALAAPAMMCFVLLAGAAQAQDLPTAEQCNDRRLFTLEKYIFSGDGILPEGVPITGFNGIQVHRAPGCNGIEPGLLNAVSFCMNIWDTTPCEGSSCKSLNTKITGGTIDTTTLTTDSVCAILAAGFPNQAYLVAATNDNAVRDDPKNRFIVALKVNPRQHVVFDIRDND